MISTTGGPIRTFFRTSICRSMLVLLAVPAFATASAQTTMARFEILRGDQMIGEVQAVKKDSPGRTLYTMTSRSEFSLIWKQVVRTCMTTEYRDGAVNYCHSAVVVNDALRDSSHMARGMDRCYVYPEMPFTCERSTQWTTARMYFEEPLGQERIFVESLLKDLTLQRTGDGRYTLVFPNGTRNHYVYRSGHLHEILVERSFFGLVFRRA